MAQFEMVIFRQFRARRPDDDARGALTLRDLGVIGAVTLINEVPQPCMNC